MNDNGDALMVAGVLSLIVFFALSAPFTIGFEADPQDIKNAKGELMQLQAQFDYTVQRDYNRIKGYLPDVSAYKDDIVNFANSVLKQSQYSPVLTVARPSQIDELVNLLKDKGYKIKRVGSYSVRILGKK